MLILEMENDEDREFIKKIYLEYYPIMKKKTYDITRDYSVVDDIIHDSIIKLIEKIETIKYLDRYKLISYIISTNKSVAINFIKKKSIQTSKIYYGSEDDMAESILDTKTNIEDIICLEEQYDELGKHMEKLSKRDRDLLYYKYILEMSDKDIDGVMDLGINNIRQYLTRARRRALKVMSREMKQYGE